MPPSMVERMTLILDAFERRSSRLNLEEVAQRTRLPRSTAHRILDQLVKLDWLDHGSLGYGLGRRALGFGDSGNNHAELRSVANPYLHELHMRTGMVVHLSALDGADEIFLDKIGGRFAGKLASKVGGRCGAHWNSGGRAMLAALTPEEVDDLVGERIRAHRGEEGWSLPELHQELNRIRQHYGLSIDRSGRRSMGLISVGAAIVGPEGPEAAVCLCPPSNAVPLERYAPLVLATTREISNEMYPELQRLAGQRGGRSGAPRVAGGHRRVLRTA
ncbi:IclR family transcriptional regulator [Tomitella fengzijianii]|uniref:IclR family transcriptional regulator n=1 Tax=Tomitella fengzijianii TaxID=2597660 RepID=A0A516X7N9_9ACTN|nr:IclR family transcriptional regulator [Tomitella fengzijianii]